jgi:4-hydroxy-tetrahydrodipicolinate synthase
MNLELPLSGVFIALATPVDDTGRPDLAAFDELIDFILERSVDGIVVGGGTAEYPHQEIAERASLLQHTLRRIAGRTRIIACVGTSSIHSTLRLTRIAADTGSDALLLPMPYFFRYSQDDLMTYCETVCAVVSKPFLLYNLPSFTNGVEAPTALRLLSTVPNLIGMKDSSGDARNLDILAGARRSSETTFLVGDDNLLLRALQAGWDGVVSGIGCFIPELITAVYKSYRNGKEAEAARYQAMLDELIQEVVRIPIPWGVRVCLAARGVGNGPMHLPPSPIRLKQMVSLQGWLQSWAARHDLKLNEVWKAIP